MNTIIKNTLHKNQLGFKGKKAFLLGLFLTLGFMPEIAKAQTQTQYDGQDLMFYLVVSAVFVIMILVLMVSVYTLNVLKLIIKKDGSIQEQPVRDPWWKRFTTKMTDAVPIEEESTVLLSHNYDGIHELDNHLPPWWKALFYLTIIFGVAYLGIYHVWKSAPLQTQEYQNELLAAAEQQKLNQQEGDGDIIDANTVTFSDETSVIARGEALYTGNCVPCHRNDGGGIPALGPNLTDEYWLHGGGISNIFKTVSEGVPATSMISWKTQMSPEDIRAVSSYVITLEGTNPPAAREPQGDKYVPDAVQTDSVATE